MSFAFADTGSETQTIGDWNMASVTNMSSMFRSAAAYNPNGGELEHPGSGLP